MAQNVSRINFALNVGEVSPRFEARQDKSEKYPSALRECKNWLPLTMGGLRRRDGWRYVAKTKFSGLANARVVNLPFVFNATQAYDLEIGDGYIRFFKDGAPLMDPDTPTVVHELVTPFALADLDLIKIGSFQSADVMYLCTGIYPVHKLARIETGPDRFALAEVAFNPPATQADEPGGAEIGSGDLTLSALTGDGITITAANAVWLEGDIGRTIVSGVGRAVIISLTSANIVVCDVVSDFTSTTITEDEWHFEGFGDVYMNPNRRTAGQGVTIWGDDPVFRSTDVGKYMLIYGGMVKLTAYGGPTKMNGIIVNTMRDVPNEPSTGLPWKDPPKTLVWSLEVEAWTDTLGYPVCGCFFQSRMWLCKEQTINGSVTGDYENYAKGSNGDDAIQVTIDDDQVNPIRWIKGLRSLQIGTGGSAYEVTASSQGKALTPSDITVLPISSRGSANILPIRVGGQLIHVQFGSKKIRELVFDFVTDKFKSPSLLTLSEHLTEENFLVDAAYQQEPDSIIWVVRDDGLLLALTYQEEENVIGWSQHPTTGEVESIAVIPRPSTGKDWLWASIQRTINDVTETFIEHMEPDADLDREWHSLQTDCSSIVTPDANLLVSGLDYLEGETVKVIGDGMLFSDAVVTAGAFTLEPAIAVTEVEVGLEYVSEGLTCEPLIPPEQGGMFLCRRWNQLGMRVRHAGRGLTLNVDDSENIGLPILRPDHLMDQAMPLQEGKLCANQTNWNPFARVRFKQTLPFPAEILNIVGDLKIAEEWCCETVDENPEFATIVVPPVVPPEEPFCTDVTPRGQQLIEILDYYVNPYPASANTRTSWGFVGEDEEIYTLAGYAECDGGNMGYTNDCCVVNHFLSGITNDVGMIESPTGGVAFANTRCGSSDRPTWASVGHTGGQFVFNNTSVIVYPIPVDEFGSIHMEAWAVKGDSVWIYSEHNAEMNILEFGRESAALLNTYTPWGPTTAFPSVRNMNLTDNYLYCVAIHDGTYAISKIARSDGSLVAELDVTNLNPQFIAVADDNLIYVVCAGSETAVYYLENFTDLVYVGVTTGQGISPFGFGTGMWKNGAFYYGSSGFAGFTPDIFKIVIECQPEGTEPQIVSVTMGGASVAAGSDINVTWAGVLVPTIGDYFIIRPAPAAGEIGFQNQIYQQATGGASDGTVAFTVPITTTPGSYVLMYCHANGVYVATSDTFTVT